MRLLLLHDKDYFSKLDRINNIHIPEPWQIEHVEEPPRICVRNGLHLHTHYIYTTFTPKLQPCTHTCVRSESAQFRTCTPLSISASRKMNFFKDKKSQELCVWMCEWVQMWGIYNYSCVDLVHIEGCHGIFPSVSWPWAWHTDVNASLPSFTSPSILLPLSHWHLAKVAISASKAGQVFSFSGIKMIK